MGSIFAIGARFIEMDPLQRMLARVLAPMAIRKLGGPRRKVGEENFEWSWKVYVIAVLHDEQPIYDVGAAV